MYVLALSSVLREPNSTPWHAVFRLQQTLPRVTGYRVRSFQLSNTLQNLRRGAIDYSTDAGVTWQTYHFDCTTVVPMTPYEIARQLNSIGLTCTLSVNGYNIEFALPVGTFVRESRNNESDFINLPRTSTGSTGNFSVLLTLAMTQQVNIFSPQLQTSSGAIAAVTASNSRVNLITIPLAEGYGCQESIVNNNDAVIRLPGPTDIQSIEIVFYDVFGEEMHDVRNWSLYLEFY